MRGLVLAALAYLGAAALILADPTSHSGTAVQLTVSALVVLGLIGLAVLVGRVRQRTRREEDSERAGLTTLPLWKVFTAVFTGALVASLGPETWVGLALGAAATVAVGAGVLLASRRTRWSPRHTAAVALAFLSVRGLLAFTYYPLLGEVAAGPKYAHNVVMLTLVLGAGWLALRGGRGHEPLQRRLSGADPFTDALVRPASTHRAAMEGAGVHVVGRP